MGLRLIRAGSMELPAEPLSTGYSGPQTYRGVTALSTADQALTVGVWAYDGALESENPGMSHQLWVVLEGSAAVTSAEGSLDACAGDVLVFEAPYAPKTVQASPDFRAIWISVPWRER